MSQQDVNPAIEVVQSLQQGELPKNEQMTKIMYKAETPRPSKLVIYANILSEIVSNLSCLQEKKILSDAQSLIEATNQLMINKNPDEKLQRFIEASAKVTQEAASTASSELYVLAK